MRAKEPDEIAVACSHAADPVYSRSHPSPASLPPQPSSLRLPTRQLTMSTPDGLPVLPVPRPERIAVVGGGIAGLAALRNLTAPTPEGKSLEATLYERNPGVGGVWRLEPGVARQERERGPSSTNGQWPLQLDEGEAVWPSPAYPQLRGNVLPRFLTPSLGFKFPPPKNNEVFPTLTETEDYILSYLSGLDQTDKRVQINTDILGVWELPPKAPSEAQRSQGFTAQSDGWILASRNKKGGVALTHVDAAVLASGWYDHVSLPAARGLREAIEQGQAVHHAKWYRGPEPYYNRKVIVVGNGNSANDMAAHIAQLYPDTHAYDDDPIYKEEHQKLKGVQPEGFQEQGPIRVYRSIRTLANPMFPSLKDRRIEDVPEIVSVSVRNGKMDVELLGGRVLQGVEAILYGTGYDGFRYPYARVWSRPLTPSESESIGARAQEVLDSQSAVHVATIRALNEAALGAYKQGTAHTAFVPDDGQPGWIQGIEKALWGDAWANAWVSLHPERLGTVEEGHARVETWSPARIVGVHKQSLYARNPSLAFSGLPVSYTPFTSSDGYMWYVRSLWDGSISPASVGVVSDYTSRLKDETERVEKLRKVRESIAPLPVPEPDAGSRSGWIPAPSGGNVAYHTLPPDEPDFLAQQVAPYVLQAKPWLQGRLDSYNAEERERERSGQYGVKIRTVAGYAVRGLGQVGPSGPVPGVGVAVKGQL